MWVWTDSDVVVVVVVIVHIESMNVMNPSSEIEEGEMGDGKSGMISCATIMSIWEQTHFDVEFAKVGKGVYDGEEFIGKDEVSKDERLEVCESEDASGHLVVQITGSVAVFAKKLVIGQGF